MRRATQRAVGVAVVVLITVALVGCQGRTTGASRFNPANNTIQLNGIGSCDTQCTAYLRYRRLGTTAWTNTPTFGVNSKVSNVPFSRAVTVSAGVRYEYQVCGKENSQDQFFCAGPDGAGGSTEVFTAGPLQPRTGPATEVYGDHVIVTGEVESTKSGEVSVWFDAGGHGYEPHFQLTANTPRKVSARISKPPGTTFQYRLCAADKPEASTQDPERVCSGFRTVTTKTGTAVTCGQRITANIRIGNHLFGCPNSGLVIGAPNITVDLNGYYILSDGEQEDVCFGPGSGPDYGIANNEGHDRVTVVNGTVGSIGASGQLGFEQGIYLNDADDNVLRNLDVVLNRCEGISTSLSDRLTIDGSTISGSRIRNVGLDGGVGGLVRNNQVSPAGAHEGGEHAGVQLDGTSQVRLEGNSVSGFEFGIELLFGSSNNQVVGNTAGGEYNAIVVVGSADNLIDRNTICCSFGGDPDPGDPGQYAGIEVVWGSSRNRVTNNRVPDTDAPGIAVGLPLSGSTAVADSNTVSGNTVSGTHADGIVVGTRSSRTTLSSNTVTGNGDDGIDVDVASATITGNIARNNADLGIEAVLGVTDGGSNRASGNGNPTRQCLNVACAP